MVTRIVVSVVLAPLFFVILFFLPPVYLAVLMAAICALASYELLRATGVAPHNGLYGFTAAAAAAKRIFLPISTPLSSHRTNRLYFRRTAMTVSMLSGRCTVFDASTKTTSG